MATNYPGASDTSMSSRMTDPGMGASDPTMGMDDDANGFTVCITVTADGQYTVGEQGEQMAPAEDIKDALTQAMTLLKTNGGADEQSAQDSFESAYNNRTPMKRSQTSGGY